MIYVIDGHNLIPKLPGFSLQDPDDEVRLIALIQEYTRLTRRMVELFFDGASPGRNSPKGGGNVRIHFIQKGNTADQAIIRYAAEKGRSARNLAVVSSDHRVQNETRALGCAVITSEQFAAELKNTLQRKSEEKKQDAGKLSDQEIDEWLSIFTHKND